MTLAAGLALLLVFRPAIRMDFLSKSAKPSVRSPVWAALHGLGLFLVIAPSLFMSAAPMVDLAHLFLGTLALGGLLALVGGALWLMPLAAWRDLIRSHARLLLPIAVISLLIPLLSSMIGLFWNWFDGLQWATFYGTAIVLAILGNDVFINLDNATIGIEEFFVEVAESCSGIEGLALTTAFMGIYALLMKGQPPCAWGGSG